MNKNDYLIRLETPADHAEVDYDNGANLYCK